MPTLTAKPITATPITARPLTAYRLGESADVSRYYLHWDGTQYAEHDEWAMTGFGDTVSEKVIATDPGNGDQYLWSSADGSWALYIADSTAHLTLLYVDEDGSTARSIDGPTIAPGAFEYIMEPTASGVVLTVDGTDYTNANVSELGSITYVCCDSSQANLFKGVWWDRRYQSPTTPADDRFYQAKDGPDALFLEDANHPLWPELVVNPGPFVDTTGYTAVVATLSVVDSALRVTKTNTNGQCRTTAPIVSGKTYLATAKLKAKTTATTTYFQGGTSAAGTQYFNKQIAAGETVTAFFTATGTTLYINLYSALTTGEYEDWEFVSVKCIETGAVLYNTDSGDWSRSKT